MITHEDISEYATPIVLKEKEYNIAKNIGQIIKFEGKEYIQLKQTGEFVKVYKENE